MSTVEHDFILTLSCPDRAGIVATVTRELAEHGASLTEAHHYREPVSSSTVLRIVFRSASTRPLDMPQLTNDFAAVAKEFAMTWRIRDAAVRPRVLVAVSKQAHCLDRKSVV